MADSCSVAPINTLPLELLAKILANIPVSELPKLATVSKFFRLASLSNKWYQTWTLVHLYLTGGDQDAISSLLPFWLAQNNRPIVLDTVPLLCFREQSYNKATKYFKISMVDDLSELKESPKSYIKQQTSGFENAYQCFLTLERGSSFEAHYACILFSDSNFSHWIKEKLQPKCADAYEDSDASTDEETMGKDTGGYETYKKRISDCLHRTSLFIPELSSELSKLIEQQRALDYKHLELLLSLKPMILQGINAGWFTAYDIVNTPFGTLKALFEKAPDKQVYGLLMLKEGIIVLKELLAKLDTYRTITPGQDGYHSHSYHKRKEYVVNIIRKLSCEQSMALLRKKIITPSQLGLTPSLSLQNDDGIHLGSTAPEEAETMGKLDQIFSKWGIKILDDRIKSFSNLWALSRQDLEQLATEEGYASLNSSDTKPGELAQSDRRMGASLFANIQPQDPTTGSTDSAPTPSKS